MHKVCSRFRKYTRVLYAILYSFVNFANKDGSYNVVSLIIIIIYSPKLKLQSALCEIPPV